MLPLLLLLPLCLPSPQAAKTTQEASVEVSLNLLDQALIDQDSTEIIRLLGAVTRLENGRVATAAGEALRHPDSGVRAAGIEALRFAKSPEALEMLHAFYGQRQALQASERLHALLLQATAQHAHGSSVLPLVRGGFKNDGDLVLKARILGLGNLQTKNALNALLKGLTQVGQDQRLLHMDEFRLALVRLTGEDLGMDAEAWLQWWAKNKPKHRIPQAELPTALLPEWNAYWEGSLLGSALEEAALPTRVKAKPNRARRQKRKQQRPAAAQGEVIEANAPGKKAQPKEKPVAADDDKATAGPTDKAKPAAKGKAAKRAKRGKGNPRKKAKAADDTAQTGEPAAPRTTDS